MTAPAPLSCIAPACNRVRRRRGRCFTCYGHVVEQIRAGLTTWAQAEAEGLLLPVDLNRFHLDRDRQAQRKEFCDGGRMCQRAAMMR